MPITARIARASVNTQTGDRIVTFVLTYPKFIHAELLTHRAFSRNTASNRAIPTRRCLFDVWRDPVSPAAYGRAQKGMVAGAPLAGHKAWLARRVWLAARYPAMAATVALHTLGLHKQHANRLLEPWQWTTCVVTATEYENFFLLRAHRDAQPEMCELALLMLNLYRRATFTSLTPGEWHLPFGDTLFATTAAAARVSYGAPVVGREDRELVTRLAGSGHWSPFEHAARAEESPKRVRNYTGFTPWRALCDEPAHFSPRVLGG